MEDLSLHVLDVVENAVAASASRVEIQVSEDMDGDLLSVEIKDNGQGMSEQTLNKALDPFFTTKIGKRVGLGLPLLAQAARESGGDIEIESKPGEGTKVRATFQRKHPDCRPLGDTAETIKVLRAAHPDVKFIYRHRNGRSDSRSQKAGDSPTRATAG